MPQRGNQARPVRLRIQPVDAARLNMPSLARRIRDSLTSEYVYEEDVAATQCAGALVKTALAKQSEVGGGSFALALDAEDAGHVIKVTPTRGRSSRSTEAVIYHSREVWLIYGQLHL